VYICTGYPHWDYLEPNVNFHQWVANTIAELGGNPDQYLRVVEQECALTCEETDADACQDLLDIYFPTLKLDLARLTVRAPTNLHTIH
jgi:hypothetical protein